MLLVQANRRRKAGAPPTLEGCQDQGHPSDETHAQGLGH